MYDQKRYDRSFRGKYRKGKASAKQRNIEWGLTFEQYIDVVGGGVCHYCDGPLDPFGHSLDRKENDKAYTKENVIASCGECNSIKSDRLSVKEMRVIASVLRVLRDEI